MKIRPLQYIACACAAFCGLVSGSQCGAQTSQEGFIALPPMPAGSRTNYQFGAALDAQPQPPSPKRNSVRNVSTDMHLYTNDVSDRSDRRPAEAHARIIRNQNATSEAVPKFASENPLGNSQATEVHQTSSPMEAVQNSPLQYSVPNTVQSSKETGRYLVSFNQNQASDLDDAAESTAVQGGEFEDDLDLGISEDDFQTPQPDDLSSLDSDSDTDEEMDLDTESEDASEGNPLEDDGDGLEDLDESNEDDDDDTDEDDEDDLDGQRKPRTFGTWPKKSMQEVRTDVRDFSETIPKDESYALGQNPAGAYFQPKSSKTFAWVAPKIRYQPLYFEDASLERYGQTKGLVKQPIVSTFEFLRDGALLPFNASKDCPKSCDTPLGFGRPGSDVGGCGCGCSSCQK